MKEKVTQAVAALCALSLILVSTPAGKAQMSQISQNLPPSLHIIADGSIDPTSASVTRVGEVYTLTGDVGNVLRIDRDNVTVDGAGYTLLGNATGGVYLVDRVGVTVKNLNVKNVGYAFDIAQTSDCTFSGNTIDGAEFGFFLFISWRNIIENNTLTNIHESAFDLFGARRQHRNTTKSQTIQSGSPAQD